MRILISILALLVPRTERPRWREEWRAELQHGNRRMILGALPDAWAMRTVGRVPPEGESYRSRPFHALDQDVRYALRTFATGKSFTLAVIGSLAIGIAATTTAFAVVNARFFRPYVAVAAQEELVRVTIGPPQRVYFGTSWNDFELLRNGLTAIDSLSGAYETMFAVASGGGEEPRTIPGLVVTGNYFDVLGVRPSLGRFFQPDENAAPWARPAVVVSHRYWQRHLAGDPAVLQRTLSVNGAVLPIIGVTPEGFDGLWTAGEMWITFALSDLVFRDDGGQPIQARAAEPFFMDLVGRLKPSATIEQGRAQAAALVQPLTEARDRGTKTLVVRVDPLRMDDPVTYGLSSLSYMAVPLIVLLIACVNAANLLLARATRRSQDWLVRLALGASRWRLVRQLLVESLLLAVGGAALGLVLCFWTLGFVDRQARGDVVIDTTVVLFVLAAAFATSLLFGLGPALSVTCAAVSRAPEAGRFMRGPFGSRTRAALVMVQAALCLGLLATGAQFTKTLRTLTDDGLPDPGQYLRVSLDLDQLRYGPPEAEAFYRQLLERVEALPAVRSAALADKDVLSGMVGLSPVRVRVPGAGSDPLRGVVTMYAAGKFFDTIGLPILQGRQFSPVERRGPPQTVIVNQPFADDVFGGNALGRVVRLTAGSDTAAAVDAMIVGVVAAPPVRRTDILPMVFYPAPLTPQPALDLLVRFDGNSAGVTAAVRTIVSAMDDRIPLQRVATGAEMRRARNEQRYTLAQTVSILGVLALVLAAAGLYGVVSYMVTLRQKEIGIRMALGAAGGSVLRLIVRQSIVPVLAGCALGAVGAVIVGALIRSRLYGVSPMDPVAFGGAALLLLLTMLVASLIPARHASRVDPITVLRQE
jgi:predicted permease